MAQWRWTWEAFNCLSSLLMHWGMVQWGWVEQAFKWLPSSVFGGTMTGGISGTNPHELLSGSFGSWVVHSILVQTILHRLAWFGRNFDFVSQFVPIPGQEILYSVLLSFLNVTFIKDFQIFIKRLSNEKEMLIDQKEVKAKVEQEHLWDSQVLKLSMIFTI